MLLTAVNPFSSLMSDFNEIGVEKANGEREKTRKVECLLKRILRQKSWHLGEVLNFGPSEEKIDRVKKTTAAENDTFKGGKKIN